MADLSGIFALDFFTATMPFEISRGQFFRDKDDLRPFDRVSTTVEPACVYGGKISAAIPCSAAAKFALSANATTYSKFSRIFVQLACIIAVRQARDAGAPSGNGIFSFRPLLGRRRIRPA